MACCFSRNLDASADAAGLRFERIAVHLAAERSDDPPAIAVVRLDAELAIDAPLADAAGAVAGAL